MGHPDLGCRFTIRPPCVDPGELVLSPVLTPADGSLAVVYQDCVRPTPAHEGFLVLTVLPFSFVTRKSSADRCGPLVEHAPTFSLLRGQLLKILKGAAIQFACCVRHAGRASEWPNLHSGDTSRGNHAAVFAFFRGEGLVVESANISNGFSLRSFSPGIGTGYSPVKQPRHTSSRECFSAEMRPRRER